MASHWLRDYSLVLEISATYRLPLTVCCLQVSRLLANLLAPVVKTVDSAIGFRTTHPLNTDLSGGSIALSSI